MAKRKRRYAAATPAPAKALLTIGEQLLLLAITELQEKGQTCPRNKDLAERLGIDPAEVTRRLRKLVEKGHIEMEHRLEIVK
ncbi:MAG TPA: helix-turn-helix domain-containing protein [Candidatus Angelobacter sp.]|nr:helix-turn-helix domain-containing protein [Candidatus Angelobacter sp.]